MNTNFKKALVVFGGGIILFWAFTKIKPYGGSKSKSRGVNRDKNFSDEQRKNAAVIVKAYSDAVKAGEQKSFLDEMNAEFAKTYNMRVVPNKSKGTFIATDLEGNKIS
jgi:hypothetical protein